MEYNMKQVESCENKYEESPAGKGATEPDIAIYENVLGADLKVTQPVQPNRQIRCTSFTHGEHVYEDLKRPKTAKKTIVKRYDNSIYCYNLHVHANK